MQLRFFEPSQNVNIMLTDTSLACKKLSLASKWEFCQASHIWASHHCSKYQVPSIKTKLSLHHSSTDAMRLLKHPTSQRITVPLRRYDNAPYFMFHQAKNNSGWFWTDYCIYHWELRKRLLQRWVFYMRCVSTHNNYLEIKTIFSARNKLHQTRGVYDYKHSNLFVIIHNWTANEHNYSHPMIFAETMFEYELYKKIPRNFNIYWHNLYIHRLLKLLDNKITTISDN